MSKRAIEDNFTNKMKKIKISNQLPDDVWIQRIFTFLHGNELFNNVRLVSSTWNKLVISTRSEIQVYFPQVNPNGMKRTKFTTIEQVDEIEYIKRVNEFIACGECGMFKNVVSLTFKSKILPSFFERIVNIDWNCLKTLNLSENIVTSEGVKQLTNGNMKNLTLLDLSFNESIDSEGIKYLTEGNIKGLTSLKLFGAKFDSEGAKYLLTGNLSGLFALNSQYLSDNNIPKYYYAMTDDFCRDAFTIHRFNNSDEMTSCVFTYYTDYWRRYGGDELGLKDRDDVEEEDEDSIIELKEKVYSQPMGRICDLATCGVGSRVFNECEREAIISIVYGQELDENNFLTADESTTPFVVIVKSLNIEFISKSIIGKTKLLEFIKSTFCEDEEDESNNKKTLDYAMIKTISQRDRESDDFDNFLLAVFIGEVVNETFVELKKH